MHKELKTGVQFSFK